MNDDQQSLDMRLALYMYDAEPGLKTPLDLNAMGSATGAMADVLGSLLSQVLDRQGETAYRDWLNTAMQRIDESARDAVGEAKKIRRASISVVK